MRKGLTTGEILSDLRLSKKMKQDEIANYLGIKRSSYSGYENSVHTPPPDKLLKLAELYGVTVDYLLGRDDKDMLSAVITEYRGKPVTLGALYSKLQELSDEQINSILAYIQLVEEGRYSIRIEKV